MENKIRELSDLLFRLEFEAEKLRCILAHLNDGFFGGEDPENEKELYLLGSQYKDAQALAAVALDYAVGIHDSIKAGTEL